MSFRAKKSLGQNFLKSKRASNQMIKAGEISAFDLVLEIGPGKGFLTKDLLLNAGHVIAIEKDDFLCEELEEKFEKEINENRLTLINGDALEADIKSLVSRHKNLKYKVLANIPYNITGLLIRKYLTDETYPEKMVLLVQKEVAQRIAASDKKESILSMSVKAYGKPKLISKVKSEEFSPAPKVDSAILLIEDISHKKFNDKTEENRFFEVVKAGFAHKRKVLIKNLEEVASKESIKNAFIELEIPEKSRAEDINLDLWLRIAKLVN